MRAAWKKLPPERRKSLWPDLMISAFRSHPTQTYAIFAATFDADLVPSYLAQDMVHYLVQYNNLSSLPTNAHRISAKNLYALVEMIFHNSPDNYLRVQQSTLYFYVRSMDNSDMVYKFYRLLLAHKHPLHKYTRLQIASRLAKDPAYKMRAVEVLKAALEATDLDINTPQGAALCTSILSMGEGGAAGKDAPSTATPAEMFDHLLRCGLNPNLITFTAIIRGLCLKHELNAALQILHLMLKGGTEPDAYVYSTIINGAKLCGHLPTLKQMAETAAAQNIWHPVIWTDFLQSIYTTAFAEARSDPEFKRPRVSVPAKGISHTNDQNDDHGDDDDNNSNNNSHGIQAMGAGNFLRS
ncbi:pentatricopeptide repeat protein [Niveomyces insectorum RCEF 264]|uniref:Pentatricopeptide repeat protein n=1 Tax=Niveomyces insectorum RCEF 264 TaxID=1081102 RepID=A0A167M8K4_9HYPO|nr:pentatricopeptide repeat protein [Niveomyces insectorum RCEF 264]